MQKIYIIIFIIISILAIYLNRAYSHIYNRNDVVDLTSYWSNPITFTNISFQDTVNFVSLGDSLTTGAGSDDPTKAIPILFAKEISKQMSIKLFNFAEAGATSDDLIKTQLDKVILAKPNYVSVFIGTNDIHALVPTSQFAKNMDYILNFLTTNTNAKIIVFNLPYLGSEKLILFPYNYFFDYQTKQYNLIITKISTSYKATIIDLYTPTKNTFAKQPNFYSIDDFHPSGEGYLMWGSLITSDSF